MARKRRKHIGFRRLSNHITAYYRNKGYGRKRAREIGNATAGKVARRKRGK